MSDLEYCERCIYAVSDLPESPTWSCKRNNDPEWNSEYECWECEDKKEIPDAED